MYNLAPSMLSADFNHLGEQLKAVEESGVKWLHIDVMDGMFVPSISFGMPVISSIRKGTDLLFDVHLMIEEPSRYIKAFKAAGADLLTVHAEACKHLDSTLRQIRQEGMRVGVALNPSTPLCVLEHVLNLVDVVMLMTVNPGFGGQTYIENSTAKIKKLRKMITDAGLDIDLEVDGGVNEKTLPIVLEAGANMIVAGSAVFGGNISERVAKLQSIIAEYEECHSNEN